MESITPSSPHTHTHIRLCQVDAGFFQGFPRRRYLGRKVCLARDRLQSGSFPRFRFREASVFSHQQDAQPCHPKRAKELLLGGPRFPETTRGTPATILSLSGHISPRCPQEQGGASKRWVGSPHAGLYISLWLSLNLFCISCVQVINHFLSFSNLYRQHGIC